jgi:hypothetical protein
MSIAPVSPVEICPIGKTDNDEAVLLRNLHDILGEQPSRKLDQSPIYLSETARLLLILSEFHYPSNMPVETVLRNPNNKAMDFFHYSFMVVAPKHVLYDIGAHTDLVSLPKETCTLVAGPLSKYYAAIIDNSNVAHSRETRLLINKLQLWMEVHEGLGLLFNRYRKVETPDGTFILEAK